MAPPPRSRPPGTRPPGPGHRPAVVPRLAPPPLPLNEQELDELQLLLDRVPQPLEPLDVTMVDGYLCGVLVQPERVPDARWLAFITDVDGRPLPGHWDNSRLAELVRRRHAELNHAISQRQWFDPWVFELDLDEADEADHHDGDEGLEEGAPPEVAAVYPWVAGFVTALEHFPGLMRREGPALNSALVLLYRHLDPDDLEDADDILEEIESLEPPADLAVAVEELVRATLLLADLGRPQPSAARKGPGAPPRPHGPAGPPNRRRF